MLYSVIICIAYIIGIIMGLYLDFYLGIVSFFLFICITLFSNYIYEYYNKKITNYKFISEDLKKKNFNKEKNKKLFLIFICFLFGYINTLYKVDSFNNKYSPRLDFF